MDILKLIIWLIVLGGVGVGIYYLIEVTKKAAQEALTPVILIEKTPIVGEALCFSKADGVPATLHNYIDGKWVDTGVACDEWEVSAPVITSLIAPILTPTLEQTPTELVTLVVDPVGYDSIGYGDTTIEPTPLLVAKKRATRKKAIK